MTEQTTALAERQQHPLAAQLEKREAALAEMLPGGERAAQRFKRVVTQAVIRTPALMECTQSNAGLASLMSAVMESATLGIEPTGTLGGAYLVPYKGKAQLIIGYRGLIELARRSGEIETIEARVVREGDDFSYQYGTEAHVRHTPNLDKRGAELTYVYAVAKLRGGATQFEVMTREQVDAIKSRSASVKSGRPGPWDSDYEEMARKTVVRRLVKYLPIAVEARDVIERDDEREFDHGAVVARVSADDRASQARQKIAQRTAALRGEVIEQGESEAVSDDGAVPGRQPSHDGGSPVEEPVYSGDVIDVDDVPFDEPAGGKGDPWMRKIHAVGAERGMSHEDLHDRAAEWFGVDSMSVLDASERAEMLDRVESMSLSEAEPAEARPPAPQSTPAEGSSTSTEDVPETATVQAESDGPLAAQPAPATYTPETLRTLAAAVLGMDATEVWGLPDLSIADFDQVWDALKLADLDAYDVWYKRQPREVRQMLMASKQSPRHRRDREQVTEAEQAIARVKAGAS